MHQYIAFATEQVSLAEPDLLEGKAHLPLLIVDSEGAPVRTVAAPANGWTHHRLNLHALIHGEDSYEAYLGRTEPSHWVGSTEC